MTQQYSIYNTTVAHNNNNKNNNITLDLRCEWTYDRKFFSISTAALTKIVVMSRIGIRLLIDGEPMERWKVHIAKSTQNRMRSKKQIAGTSRSKWKYSLVLLALNFFLARVIGSVKLTFPSCSRNSFFVKSSMPVAVVASRTI
uniref:Uncharacterized protein n=1 Tax=Glossina brevipalpis TaxID=37001 RepID=A0A1A9W0N8_9MUSC